MYKDLRQDSAKIRQAGYNTQNSKTLFQACQLTDGLGGSAGEKTHVGYRIELP